VLVKPRPFLIVVVVAALAGLFFAGFSTYDFAQHLDRQVHGLHCSFIPGFTGTVAAGSGCLVTLMSPYSSVLRSSFWGGIPVALPGMSVFAFLAFWALYLLTTRRETDRRATLFLLAACGVPLLTSIVMAAISFITLGAACKLCIGIYLSSLVAFPAALLAWRSASRGPALGARVPAATGAADTLPASAYDPSRDHASDALSLGALAAAAALGVAFVLVPVGVYVSTMPDYTRFIGTCGTLAHPADPGGLMVTMSSPPGGRSTVEVLDPLCPSCASFEARLSASGLDEQLSRKLVLFPLDSTCNWMVDEPVHPGACTVSEAVLCAGPAAPEVLAWAFDEGEQIREATRTDPGAAARLVRARFPQLGACLGTPGVRAKLNRSLRWAVSNRLPVLTPQLYVEGRKLCDEDTDLGMDFALSHLLAQGGR
jgi:uncharacterized membrane protein